jgi:hypothetical protein
LRKVTKCFFTVLDGCFFMGSTTPRCVSPRAYPIARYAADFRSLAAVRTITGRFRLGHIHIDQNAIERCFRPTKVGLRKLPVHPSPQGGMAIGGYLQHHRDVSTVRGEPGSVPALGAPETGRRHQQDGERSPASRFCTIATTDEQHHGMRTVTFVLID